MNINDNHGSLHLTNVPCFALALTLDCGQAFRWHEKEQGVWQGVANNKALTLSQIGDEVILYNTTLEDYQKIWKNYFDFDRDYDAILKSFLQDSLLRNTIQQYYGIRILQQDSWEALLSFVFSSSNNIKRIRSFLERLSCAYGEQLSESVFAFPTAQALANVPTEAFRSLGAGYRDKFLHDCAVKVANGTVNLAEIATLDLPQARQALMQIDGVGPKVAECALLFGFGRLDAFPVDRWITRVLECYPHGLPSCFAGFEGIAQQYMFHYARMNLGAK